MTVAPVGAVVWPSGGTSTIGVTTDGNPTEYTEQDALRPPQIELNTNRIAFGSIPVRGGDSASATEILAVRNEGDAPLSLTEPTITGRNATAFEIIAGNRPATLVPGERLLIAITFDPKSVGNASARLQFETNDPDRNRVNVSLSGVGVEVEPTLTITPESHDFGRVPVGATDTRRFLVTNNGTAPVTVTNLTVGGEGAEAFRITDRSETTIPPGESQRITVAFNPKSDGVRLASITVERSNGSPVTVDLAGIGVAPDIEISTETIRFTNTTDGTSTERLTITNVGTAPLTVQTLRVVGPDQTVFDLNVSGPLTIDPNHSRSVTVTFNQTGTEPRFGTVHVVSNDSNEPQRNVWLTNTVMVADVSPSTVLPNRTIVNATIVNAQANISQTINISWPLTRDDDVAIDSITFTPERGANFTINVTKSTERFEGTPPFNLSDGTQDIAFISMNSTIINEDLSNVTVTFRVSKTQLTGNETGPEDVTLYTRRNGTWVELPTELVNESQTHYFFEAKSPGLLDFATGIKQAKFRIDDAVVSVTELQIGEGVDVLVRVTNVGGADGTHVVKLIRNDTVVDRRALSIAPNGTRQTIFSESFGEPGVYELYVNDHFVANVTVRSSNTTTNRSHRWDPSMGPHRRMRPLGGLWQ